MRTIRTLAIGVFAACALLASDPLQADARRGASFFASQSCLECHSVNGNGGRTASDLGRRIGRDYTPAVMAAVMWNHAPAMWSAMRKRGIAKSYLNEERAADLFAYFYSARYFDKPGDAGRGKQLFTDNRCAGCHGIDASPAGGGPPVSRWRSLADPIVLTQQMWNHPAAVRRSHLGPRPPITSQALTDMLLYLQNLPETRGTVNYALALTEIQGVSVQQRGCGHAQCHVAGVENRMRNRTLTDVAAAVWNHQPSPFEPAIARRQIQEYVTDVWAGQFFREDGSLGRGKRVFTAKGCVVCHNDPTSGAPSLARRERIHTAISMVAALWEHGPRIFDEMNRRRLSWPRFSSTEMSDLITYLNALPQASPRPLLLRASILFGEPDNAKRLGAALAPRP